MPDTPNTTQPLDLDDILVRAGHLYEYVPQSDEADVLAGTDVPAMADEIHRLRAQILGQAASSEDTLPAWLNQRFDPRGPDWDQLGDDDRSYWEHQARAVRRAVARGGFKASRPASEETTR